MSNIPFSLIYNLRDALASEHVHPVDDSAIEQCDVCDLLDEADSWLGYNDSGPERTPEQAAVLQATPMLYSAAQFTTGAILCFRRDMPMKPPLVLTTDGRLLGLMVYFNPLVISY